MRNVSATIALLGLVAALGCENMGLYDAGPAEEARQQPSSELVASVIQPGADGEGRELIADGRLWVPFGRPLALDAQDMRPVGSANGRAIHARTWDRPPYDALFTPVDEGARWLPHRPVIGGGGGH